MCESTPDALAAPDRISPRTVFVPRRPADPVTPARRPVDPRTRSTAALRGVVDFYRDPLSWVALLVTSVMLCYVAGAAMFWFHADYLGEGGPAIPWYAHWTLDSTFAFVCLAPAVALLLPLSTWVAANTAGRLWPAAVPGAFAVLLGVTFAVLTTPGPLAHDLLVGRGTWLAGQVTQWVGDPGAPPTPHHEYGLIAAFTQQFGFGLPLYVATAYAAVRLTGLVTGRQRRPWTLGYRQPR